jgi:hypothetical protein
LYFFDNFARKYANTYPFLGVPLHELRNEFTLLDVLDRRQLLPLFERLAETAVHSARTHLLDQWLIERLGLGHDRSVLISPSLALLRQQDGQLPISELAQKLVVSQRQLE